MDTSHGCFKSGRKRRVWHVASTYEISVGKPEGNRPLGRCMCRWEYLTDLRETGREVVNTAMKLRVP
jgi:hypothetical protein